MVGLNSSLVRDGVGCLDDVCRGRSGGGNDGLDDVGRNGGGMSSDDGGGGNDGLDDGGSMSSDDCGGGEPLVLVVDADGSGGGNDGLDDVARLDYPSGVVHAGGLNKVSWRALVVSTILVVLAS